MTHRIRFRVLGLSVFLVCLLAAPMALRVLEGWPLTEFLVALAVGFGLLKQSFVIGKASRWPQAVGALLFAHLTWICLSGGVSSFDDFSLSSATTSVLFFFLGCCSLLTTGFLFSTADSKVSLDSTSSLPMQPLSWGLGLVAVLFGLSSLSNFDGFGSLGGAMAIGLTAAQLVFGALLLKGRQIAPACFGLGLTAAGLSGLMVMGSSELRFLIQITGTQMAFYGTVAALAMTAFSISGMIGAEVATGGKKSP